MKNFLNPGETMTYKAPAGGVVSGLAYLIGSLFVVAEATQATAGAQFAGVVEGHVTLPKPNEGDLVEGQALFWDATNLRVTVDPTAGLPIGTVGTGGALAADLITPVLLHGMSLAGRIHTIRKRLTIAAINAGATLLPALPGVKYRMVDALAIAVGGAAGAVTTVDVKATQAAAPVKLVAYAQASLAQSAVLRAGGAGAAVLADGASFAPNDVNTAITVGITGANITVATNIDFEFTYTLE